jgi:CHAT domain-containing protein/Tfp pilus assembly protein PilF
MRPIDAGEFLWERGSPRFFLFLLLILGGQSGLYSQVPDSLPDERNSLEQQGITELGQRKFEEAWLSFRAAEQTYAKEEDSLGIARVKARLAYLHIQDFALDSARNLLQQALDLQNRQLPPTHPDLGRTYYYLGQTAFRDKDNELAREYLEQALQIFRLHDGPKAPSLAPVLEMLALCFWRNEQAEAAAATQLEALSLMESRAPHRLSGVYLNLGLFQAEAQQAEKALESFEEALRLRQAALGANHPQLGQIYQNIGMLQLKQGQAQAALPNFQKGYQLCIQAFPPLHPIPARFATNQANAYHALGRWEEAVFWHQKALEHLLPNMLIEEQDAPLPEGIGPFAGELVETLRDKGLTLLAKNQALTSPAIIELELALNHFRLAANLVDSLRLGFQSEASKLTYGTRARKVYEGGIQTAWLLHAATEHSRYLNEAFRFAESARALVLLEAIQAEEGRKLSGIPPAIQAREDSLRQALAAIQQDRLEAENRRQAPEAIEAIRSQQFALKREYEAFLQTLAASFPRYHRHKYGLQVLNVNEAIALLPTETAALVEYFTGEDHLFVFVLGKEQQQWLRLPKPAQLDAQVEAFREALLPRNWQTAGSHLYDSLGSSLYQSLIAPLQAQAALPPQLVLIPDEVLAYLPFDALLTQVPQQPGKYQTYPYFGRPHQLSYAYSATWLREVQALAADSDTEPQLLAVAPVAFARMGALPFSRGEVQNLQKRFGGKLLLEENASRHEFLAWAERSQLIHLSTHAGLNNQTGALSAIYLAGNDSLTLQEISTLRLPAELVVLSACETGVGKLLSGEGLQSLGRAFSMAGSKSLLATLWQVNDGTTASLMEVFYDGLAQGLSKDEALHRAKMAHLSTADQLLAHPYFWAAYLAIGDMAPLKMPQRTALQRWGWKVGLFLLLIVGLSSVLYLSSRKKVHPS